MNKNKLDKMLNNALGKMIEEGLVYYDKKTDSYTLSEKGKIAADKIKAEKNNKKI